MLMQNRRYPDSGRTKQEKLSEIDQLYKVLKDQSHPKGGSDIEFYRNYLGNSINSPD